MDLKSYNEWKEFIDTDECDEMCMSDTFTCTGCKFIDICDEFYSVLENKSMLIRTIEDNNTNFNLVELRDDSNIGKKTPHCNNHGAMNKVSKFKGSKGGYWRCNALGGCRAGCIEEEV